MPCAQLINIFLSLVTYNKFVYYLY